MIKERYLRVPTERRAELLALFLHRISIECRGNYIDGQLFEKFRAYNEITHTIAGNLVAITSEDGDYDWETVYDIVRDFANMGECNDNVAWAMDGALALIGLGQETSKKE